MEFFLSFYGAAVLEEECAAAKNNAPVAMCVLLYTADYTLFYTLPHFLHSGIFFYTLPRFFTLWYVFHILPQLFTPLYCRDAIN